MGIDAFVIRGNLDESTFLDSFLNSTDFTLVGLKSVLQQLGGYIGKKTKADIIDEIVKNIKPYNRNDIGKILLQYLVDREKEWMSIKINKDMIDIDRFHARNPIDLLFHQGDEDWYGPIIVDDANVQWFIRVFFIDHCEWNAIDATYNKHYVRWLCFARLENEVISLHWKGFTHLPSGEDLESNSKTYQFSYWKHVPQVFLEIENKLGIGLSYINLHKAVLYDLWNEYQDHNDYKWIHRKIRAESNGVALNAHAGSISRQKNEEGVLEMEADKSGGIFHLATTIRKSVQYELFEKYSYQLPHPEDIDFIILRTLIREYGALSYEFSLEQNSNLLFRSHNYFGMKEGSDSPDSFPHLRIVNVTSRHPLDQLRFLLLHTKLR